MNSLARGTLVALAVGGAVFALRSRDDPDPPARAAPTVAADRHRSPRPTVASSPSEIEREMREMRAEGDRAIAAEPTDTEEQRRLKANLEQRLGDLETRFLFDYTLHFLRAAPGAVNAAKFAALTMSHEQSPALTELMAANASALRANSATIMAALEPRVDELAVNAYFHNRMLNLVHQLEVPPERKAAFYGKTMSAPLVLDDTGNLADESLAAELAIILAHQDASYASIADYVANAVDANRDSPTALEALRVRVTSYFPAASGLFAAAAAR